MLISARPSLQRLKRFNRINQQRGVSMMEVLIALVLLVTTLLGATALQITGLQTNRSAYYRTQASLLAYDIADRIRLNAVYATGDNDRYSISTSSMATPSGSTCATNVAGCTAEQIRNIDLREWAENFIDINGVGQDGGNYRNLLPGGAGVVTASGSSFSVQVSWQELDWNVSSDSNKADTTKTFTLDFTATR
ncbi:type IV pilus modification protein PilV [Motiliproteus sp.]|uniref:type IV pilus modification protein PilV n=1 Tax=Motiliproteus sp. TaxID=1898955 RepID=UPI003BA92FF6